MPEPWRRAPDRWTTADLYALERLRRREGQSQRLLYRILTWWNLTLAVSNVLHYLGGEGLGYGLALAVHVGVCLYAGTQLWRTRHAPT